MVYIPVSASCIIAHVEHTDEGVEAGRKAKNYKARAKNPIP